MQKNQKTKKVAQIKCYLDSKFYFYKLGKRNSVYNLGKINSVFVR